MATGSAAGDGIFRSVFDGCIFGSDLGIRRRPYHRNCTCALHKSKGHCPHSSKYNNVSYPVRRSWSESSLSLMAAAGNSSPSPYSSPVVGPPPAYSKRAQLVFFKEEEDFDS